MTAKTLHILDQSLEYSLCAFLAFFLVALFFIAIRTPRHSMQARSAALAVFFSTALGAIFFVFVSFTPLPFLENFATARSLEVVPLRLTALIYERFYEGFSLDGEVWNQSKEPMDGLLAVIRIRGAEQDILEEVAVPVTPQPLKAGTPGTFQLRYEKNSPFLYGYQVSFVTPWGVVIPHLTGFDVH